MTAAVSNADLDRIVLNREGLPGGRLNGGKRKLEPISAASFEG